MNSAYTVKDASKILGFSTNSIYKFVNTGRLKSTRGNSRQGRFRIPKKALDDFLGHELTQEYLDSIIKPPQPALYSHPKEVTLEPKASTPTTDLPIPINVTRGLIVVSLLFILADIFISQNFSILQQLIRLSLLTVIILITYQFGTLHPPVDENH